MRILKTDVFLQADNLCLDCWTEKTYSKIQYDKEKYKQKTNDYKKKKIKKKSYNTLIVILMSNERRSNNCLLGQYTRKSTS